MVPRDILFKCSTLLRRQTVPWQLPHLCSKCYRPSSTYFLGLGRLAPPETTARNLLNDSQSGSLTLPSTTKDHGGATRWAALRFSTWIYLTRGEAELATRRPAEEATVLRARSLGKTV